MSCGILLAEVSRVKKAPWLCLIHLIVFPMTTLFSKGLSRIRRVAKKTIVGLVLLSVVLSASPAHVGSVLAQPATSPAVNTTGFTTADEIERGITETGREATGIFANQINGVAAAVGSFVANILLLFSRLLLHLASFCIDFIMVVAGYNGYLESTAVNIGWTVVRDITNMLFIVILLVIAFATILGLEGYAWKQLLPKLVSAAILVNFSRTICGVLIDASQVFMMTFLNAVSATIGGNIINAFKLPSFESFHPQIQSQQLTSPGIISAAALALAFSALVAGVLGAYVFILLGRLIRLWVLIVLSPLAFALGILPSTSGMSHKWWTELTDNLVTGPIIMFFVWLSLIVVGAGQANQELLKGSRLADKTPIEQAFGVQEQSATITDIGRWNNLANFVIAIGMLFAGAKVASAIGGSSGNLLQSGLDYGKKVALAGLGYGLIRRFAGGAQSAAQGAAAKSGSWALNKLAAPGKRLGEVIGTRLRTRSLEKETAGNIKAAEIEKKMQEAREKGQLGNFAALTGNLASWYYSSDARKNKNVENWKKIEKMAEERRDMSLGTGGTSAGIRKKRDELLTRQMREKDELDKKEGELKIQQSMEQEVQYVQDTLSPEEKMVAQATADLAEKKRAGVPGDIKVAEAALLKAQSGLAKKQRELMDPNSAISLFRRNKNNKKVDPQFVMDYYRRGQSKIKGEAHLKEMQHIMHNAGELALAEERDKILISEGKTPVFANEVRKKQQEERRKLLSKMDSDLAMGMIEELSKKMQDTRAQLALPSTSADHRKELQKVLNEQIEEMADFQSTNAARGPQYATEGLRRATQSFASIDVSADDVVGQQACEFSAILGRQVSATANGVKAALDELKTIKGENFNAFMASYMDSLEAAASKGAINKSGLIKSDYDSIKKTIVYTVTDASADAAYVKRSRDNAISQSRTALATLDNINDSLDNIGGKVTISSAQALKHLTDILANKTKEQISHISGNFKNSLGQVFANMSAADVKRVHDHIFASTTNPQNQLAIKDWLDSI